MELYLKTVGSRPIQALEAQPTAREGVEAMLREAIELFQGLNTPPGCLIALGAVNCAPASKSVEDHMSSYRVQAPLLIRKRLQRGVAEGDVPDGVDLDPLISLYATFFQGLPLTARDGTSRKDLLAGITAATAAWDRLIGPARARRKST